MSIVSALGVPVVVADWELLPCIGCEQVLLVPSGATPICADCQRSAAENEARRLLTDVGSLIRGEDIFADLPVLARVDKLRAMGLPPATFVAGMSNSDLMELCRATSSDKAITEAATAEICRRSAPMFARGAPDEPSPQERADIEHICACMDADAQCIAEKEAERAQEP